MKKILVLSVVLVVIFLVSGSALAWGRPYYRGGFGFGISIGPPVIAAPPYYGGYYAPNSYYGPGYYNGYRPWVAGHWERRWTPYGWQRYWVPGYWR